MGQKICESDNCNNAPKGNRKHCSTCRHRKWRKNNPFKYHYYNLRNRARQRRKQFNLSFQEFKKLWMQHPEKWKEKLETEGLSPWEIDRKDTTKGYVYSNLRIISKTDNIKKFHEEDKHVNIETKAPF